jgi:membrane protease YdiL (CAAX protease family)
MGQRLAGIFWNRDERRLRAGWRLLFFVVLLALCAFLVQMPLNQITAALFNQMTGPLALEVSRGLDGLVSILAITGAVVLGGWLLDRRRFADFGFHLRRDWWIDFGFGLALGALLMAGVFAAELALGWVTVTDIWRGSGGLAFPVAILTPLIAFLFVGFYEELLVRGYLLRNLAEGLGFEPISARWALLLAWLLRPLWISPRRQPQRQRCQFCQHRAGRAFSGVGHSAHRRTGDPHRPAYHLELLPGQRLWLSGQRDTGERRHPLCYPEGWPGAVDWRRIRARVRTDRADRHRHRQRIDSAVGALAQRTSRNSHTICRISVDGRPHTADRRPRRCP